MGERSASVSVSEAVSSMLAVPRIGRTVFVGTFAMLAATLMPESLGLLASVILITLTGYQVTLARHVAFDYPLPPAFAGQLGAMLRRGISVGMIVGVPPFLLVAGLLFLARPPVPEALGALASSVAWAALILSLLVLIPLSVVAFGSRYLFFDRFREGFHYLDALGRFRRFWRQGLVVAAVPAAWTLISLSVRNLVGRAIGISNLRDAGKTAWDLATGHFSAAGAVSIIVQLVLTALGFAVILVCAHLLGQYTRLAYVPDEALPQSVEQAHQHDCQQVD